MQTFLLPVYDDAHPPLSALAIQTMHEKEK